MTALTKYQRLETSGLWRETPASRAREVVAGLRDATLVLTDPLSELPLTQWSLPAIQRLNPGRLPARYSPGEETGEDLELDDADMIAALETVHRVVERRKPRPGRLRGMILGATALAVVGVLVFWLPGKLKTYTADVLPAPTRADLGDMALADIARLTGQPCKSVPGRRAAVALAERLFPQAPPRIEVLREALTAPAHLPGNILLLPASLVETADGPDVIAGHLLIEDLRSGAADAVNPLLDHFGLGATLRLLTTGAAPPEAAKGYGEVFLAMPPAPMPSAEAQLETFKTTLVSSAAYGASARAGNPAAAALIELDPYPLGAPTAVVSDEIWLEFQAICAQ